MSQLSFNQIRIFTALISLLLSATAFYSDDIINSDGILYIQVTEAFLQSGFSAMMQLYNWPFFAMIIAGLHSLTAIPLELCSNIINSLFFVIFTDTLLLINNKTFSNKQNLIIAAVLIICFQSFNEYRDYIIRDIAYWAFCGLSLYRFIIFLESPSIRNATLWQTLAIIAVLFRIEGVVFLLGLPLYLFAHSPVKIALKSYLQLNFLLIIIALSTITFVLSQPELTASFGKLSTVLSYIKPTNFTNTLIAKSDIIANQVLNQYSARFSTMILVSGLIFMLFYKLIKALSLPYIAIYIVAVWNRKNESHPYQKLIIYYVILNITLLLAFLFHSYFMSTRYTIMAVSGLFLLMLPSLCNYIERLLNNKSRKTLSIIILILFVSLVDSMTQSASKAYIQSTAIWASDNLPQSSHILTDDNLLYYYVLKHNPIAKIDVKHIPTNYKNYQYIIVVEKNKQHRFQPKNMLLKPIYHQLNKHGDRAIVYKVTE